jgi:hypothetical protein
MAVKPGNQINLETIIRAAKKGDLAVVECRDRATGKQVDALCAIGFDGKEHTITPLAKMFEGNPYEELIGPDETAGEGGHG